MKRVRLRRWIAGALSALVMGAASAADMQDDYAMVGVIGASYENGHNADGAPFFGVWYLGGYYKTWVEHAAAVTDASHHWYNYARGASWSEDGVPQLEKMLFETAMERPEGDAVAPSSVESLVIGLWGNDVLWIPYNQTVVDQMIGNVRAQIALAKSRGVEKIVVTGWPRYEDLDLDAFIARYPELTDHINEADWNRVKAEYYAAFAEPNPDWVFVDPWCRVETFDDLHPTYASARRASAAVLNALRHYDRMVGQRSGVRCL